MPALDPYGLRGGRSLAGPMAPRPARNRPGRAGHVPAPRAVARERGGSMSCLLERPKTRWPSAHWSSLPCPAGAGRVPTPSQRVEVLLRVYPVGVTGGASGRRSFAVGNERRWETNWFAFTRHAPVLPAGDAPGAATKEVRRARLRGVASVGDVAAFLDHHAFGTRWQGARLRMVVESRLEKVHGYAPSPVRGVNSPGVVHAQTTRPVSGSRERPCAPLVQPRVQ